MITENSDNIVRELVDDLTKNMYSVKVDKVNPDNSVNITLTLNRSVLIDYLSNQLSDNLCKILNDKYGISCNQNIKRDFAFEISYYSHKYFE